MNAKDRMILSKRIGNAQIAVMRQYLTDAERAHEAEVRRRKESRADGRSPLWGGTQPKPRERGG